MIETLTRKLKSSREMRLSWKGLLRPAAAFFAGYPITPATEIAEMMAERFAPLNGVFLQMKIEIASVCRRHRASFGECWLYRIFRAGISLMQEGVGLCGRDGKRPSSSLT